MNNRSRLKFFVTSLATSIMLIGCGGGSGSSAAFVTADGSVVNPTNIVVERGPVLGATVVDSSTPSQVGIATNNNYSFKNPVVYPIIVSGGFIDIDGDGTYSEGDTDLGGLKMKSYSEVVTPITTYIANELGDNVSEEERETLVTQKYEELANLLGENVSINDLKKVPSKMENKGSIIAVNAIYKELLEDKDGKLDKTMLKEEFSSLTELLKDLNKEDLSDGESLSQLLEKVLRQIVKENPNLVHIANSEDVKNYQNSFTLFNYLWEEQKFVFSPIVFANGNSYLLDNGNIQLTAVKKIQKYQEQRLKLIYQEKV